MSAHRDDFISHYLSYIGETEAPMFYHRWCCLSMIGAYLGRQYSFKLGHFEVYPNMYVMLLGSPGARKSTAIKIAKRIITSAGYDKISADRSTKEKFLLDLAGEDTGNADDVLDKNLWGGAGSSPAEMYIACDEFNDFIGINNGEFISLLGNFWDYTGPPYENRIKNGKSVSITDPTISILGGNTPTSFAKAFPSDLLGQGFFSRLLLIHGEPTGRRITFPDIPNSETTTELIAELQRIKQSSIGTAELTPTAKHLLDKIYQNWKGLSDVRFDSYSNRRFTHLLKLCLITSAARYSKTISDEDVVYANTILTHTEHLMPKAMGEFGKSRNSDFAHRVVQILGNATLPVAIRDIWVHLSTEMEKINDLADLLRNMTAADKVITTTSGFLLRRTQIIEVRNDVLNYDYLTTEEREMTK